MTNNQDALRCADELATGENFYYESSMSYDYILSEASANAAAHIRRLVEENEAKDSLLRQAWAVIRWQCFGECRTEGVDGLPTPSEIDAAIRQHLGQKGETQ